MLTANKQITISVVTPVYNGERFIESCLQTVIDQECEQIEHVIMDGGSTDRTVEIIKDYAARYPHICWRSEKDRGQSDAMNKAIREAKNDVLAILNCDDYYEAGTLKKVQELFRELPDPSMLIGNCNVVDENGKLERTVKPEIEFHKVLLPWRYWMPLNPISYFYHRTLHNRLGFYEEDEHNVMDYEFLLRAIPAVHVKYVDEIFGNWRFYAGAKTFDNHEQGKLWDYNLRVANRYAAQRGTLYQMYVKTSFWLFKHANDWDTPTALTALFKAKWRVYEASWKLLDKAVRQREEAAR